MKLTEYALKFIGRPYIWGGDSSGKFSGGFDCSGLVVECLQAFGMIPQKDFTAQSLFSLLEKSFRKIPVEFIEDSDILFWGKGTSKISHVSISLGNGMHIEAGGGGSKCTKLQNSTGMVRIRPISSRSDLVAVLRKP